MGGLIIKRKARRKKDKPKRIELILGLAVLIITVLFILFYFGQSSQKQDYKKIVSPTPSLSYFPLSHSPYPEKQLKEFYKQEIQPILEELSEQRYPLAEINQRFRYLVKSIEQQYQAQVVAKHSPKYDKNGPHILQGSSLKDGVPAVWLFMPAVFDRWKEFTMSNDPEWRKKFNIVIVAGFIHELDHLALGHGEGEKIKNINDLIDREAGAWAQTCQYTFELIVQNWGEVLTSTNKVIYQKWKEVKGDITNPEWRLLIKKIYGPAIAFD